MQEVDMITNSDIRAEARTKLTGQWNNGAIVMLLFFLIHSGVPVIPVIGSVAWIFLTGPFTLGLAFIFLRVARGDSFNFEMLFKGLYDYGRSFVAGLLVWVYTMLWALLLIVPGIIAALSYSMTFFILAENPTIGADEAISRSKQMMYGHKTDLFMLGLSFLGWFILGIIGFGIPLFWIGAYYYAALAVFYEEIKGGDRDEVTGYVRMN